MKNIVRLSIVLILMTCMVILTGSNVYAALTCSVDMNIAKTEYSKNEIFTVDVNISNISTDRGVIAFGATLEYDKDSLTLERMEGLNGWETPMAGGSYNEDNGIMAITRGAVGKNDETILRLTFKVKENAKTNAKVTLKDVSVSDGTLARIATISKEITIKDAGTDNPGTDTPGTDNPGTDTPGTDNPGTNIPGVDTPNNGSNQSGNGNQGGNTNQGNNNNDGIKEGVLPKTGEVDIAIIAIIGVILLIAGFFYIKAKKVSDVK